MDNRELKFRAWDESRKEMITEFGLLKENMPQLLQNEEDGYIFCGHSQDNGDWLEPILMQYTGLKDKNGKEIYEGDILKQRYYPIGSDKKVIEYYKIGVVVYGLNSYGVKLKFEGTNILDESKKLSHHRTSREIYKHPSAGENWVDNSFYGEYEIIGNIYENPELLTQ